MKWGGCTNTWLLWPVTHTKLQGSQTCSVNDFLHFTGPLDHTEKTDISNLENIRFQMLVSVSEGNVSQCNRLTHEALCSHSSSYDLWLSFMLLAASSKAEWDTEWPSKKQQPPQNSDSTVLFASLTSLYFYVWLWSICSAMWKLGVSLSCEKVLYPGGQGYTHTHTLLI